ncbi:hypothetical protein ACHAWF_001317 [Thalassiosira exigua]
MSVTSRFFPSALLTIHPPRRLQQVDRHRRGHQRRSRPLELSAHTLPKDPRRRSHRAEDAHGRPAAVRPGAEGAHKAHLERAREGVHPHADGAPREERLRLYQEVSERSPGRGVVDHRVDKGEEAVGHVVRLHDVGGREDALRPLHEHARERGKNGREELEQASKEVFPRRYNSPVVLPVFVSPATGLGRGDQAAPHAREHDNGPQQGRERAAKDELVEHGNDDRRQASDECFGNEADRAGASP